MQESQVKVKTTESAPRQKGAGLLASCHAQSPGELVFIQLLFGALGSLLCSAELLFGVRPFGVALAAAGSFTFPAAALGAAIFALAVGDPFTLVSVGIVSVTRLLFSLLGTRGDKPFFGERIAFRMAQAALAVFASGLWRLIEGGLRYYDLFALLLTVAAATLATLLLSGIFEKDERFPYSREAAIGAVIFIAVFALRKVDFFGIYPAAAVCAGLSFYLIAHRDMLWGSVGGLLAGLAFDWQLSPAFLLCAVGFGLLQKSSRGGGVLAGSAAAAAYALAVNGTAGLSLILPALLCAGALFLASDSAGLIEGSPNHRSGLLRRRAARQSASSNGREEGEERLREISGALLDLSATFFELSARLRRPAVRELRHLCDQTFDQACPHCTHRDICWGSEYKTTASALGALANTLHQKGAIRCEQLPATLTARCARAHEIVERINAGAIRLFEGALRGDKTAVVASDYASLGRLLRDSLEQTESASVTDAAAGERIYERLTRLGYKLDSAALCGKSHRKVILCGISLPGRHLKTRELRRILEQHCHFSLGVPEVRESDGVCDMIFPEHEEFKAVVTKQARAKRKGEGHYCGDSVTTLSVANGYDFSLLCDGMGSGNTAALTSALASNFLSKLLLSGNRAETSLRMLNGFLAARGSREDETSTTVDLLQLDRVSGEITLYKCGAAPTFLLRKGEVSRFFSRTAPVGILESLDAERLCFCAEVGDVLLQVSDGVTGGEEDVPWLAELLRTRWDGDAEHFARLVLARAQSGDDLSVLVTEIKKPHDGAAEPRDREQSA